MDNFRSIEMVPREGSTSSLGLQLLLDSTLAHISTSIVLVLIASIVIVILNILTSILEPMNYRLVSKRAAKFVVCTNVPTMHHHVSPLTSFLPHPKLTVRI